MSNRRALCSQCGKEIYQNPFNETWLHVEGNFRRGSCCDLWMKRNGGSRDDYSFEPIPPLEVDRDIVIWMR